MEKSNLEHCRKQVVLRKKKTVDVGFLITGVSSSSKVTTTQKGEISIFIESRPNFEDYFKRRRFF